MRLIDADALGVGRCSKDILPAAYCAGWNGLIGLIEKAPTIDAVPVVRCGQCKFDNLCCRNVGKDGKGQRTISAPTENGKKVLTMTPDIWRMLFFILLGIVLGNLFERWRFK